jgi:hypothetical protein
MVAGSTVTTTSKKLFKFILKKIVILSIAKDLLQEPITRAKYGVEDPSLCSG